MELTAYLDQQLRAAGVPIVGVSLLSTADRIGWSVQFAPAATPAQKATAQTLLANVAIDPATLAAAGTDADATAAAATTIAKALCAVILDVKLGRRLTLADTGTVQNLFGLAQTYYKFIVQNGL